MDLITITSKSGKTIILTEEQVLYECVLQYVFPQDYDTNPYYDSQYGQLYTKFKQQVFCEFIRFSIDKHFTENMLPKQSRTVYKEEFKSQARLLSQVWTVVKLLHNPVKSRFLIFCEVLIDEALPMFIFGKNTTTATKFYKTEQTKNRQLQSLNNPFNPKEKPATWCFIDNCIRQAEKSDDFRRHYMEMINLRMKAVQHLVKNQPKLINQSCRKPVGRGRKSV